MGKTLNIIYEDNHVIVVEKGVGILSQEDITQDPDMVNLLKAYLKEKYQKPGNVFVGLVHRLDRMVGGIMVFAKTSKAASRLSEAIRNHTFEKHYLAVVNGEVHEQDTLIHYLKKDEKTNTVSVEPNDINGAKRSVLSYKKLETKNNLSLVEIDLTTGRSHQIRVQFKEIGHSLFGDQKYGHNQEKVPVALFAYKIRFQHPTTKEVMTFQIFPQNHPFSLFQFPYHNV